MCILARIIFTSSLTSHYFSSSAYISFLSLVLETTMAELNMHGTDVLGGNNNKYDTTDTGVNEILLHVFLSRNTSGK